jgi:hypothetical protein
MKILSCQPGTARRWGRTPHGPAGVVTEIARTQRPPDVALPHDATAHRRGGPSADRRQFPRLCALRGRRVEGRRIRGGCGPPRPPSSFPSALQGVRTAGALPPLRLGEFGLQAQSQVVGQMLNIRRPADRAAAASAAARRTLSLRRSPPIEKLNWFSNIRHVKDQLSTHPGLELKLSSYE